MLKRFEPLLMGALGALLAVLLVGPLVTPASATLIRVPTGNINYFNATSCPSGWTEYTATQGTYITGLLSGGTLHTLVGTALTNQENRSAAVTVSTAHTHGTPVADVVTGGAAAVLGESTGGEFTYIRGADGTARQPGSASNSVAPGSYFGIAGQTTSAASSATSSGESVVSAPYAQLLVCQKS